MKWEGREESGNVEDRRRMGPRAAAIGGGGTVIVLLIAMFLGIDPQKLLQFVPQGQQGPGPVANQKFDPEEERQAKFTKVILKDTEDVWNELFAKMGKRYQEPKLVLFSGQVTSACGMADAAVGPFYCPGDSQVYIDMSFYRDMEKQLQSPGEFARAYVIAHEVGHHVQRLLGYSQRVNEVRVRMPKGHPEVNKATVRLELQADFLAGVWAHHAQRRHKFLEPGDIDSAMKAAFEIGDDRLQKKGRGYVVPDSFTHGTSAQRQRWFMHGFKTGDVNEAAKTFELPYDEL